MIPMGRDGSIVRVRDKSDPIRGQIIRFESDFKNSDPNSIKKNPNPNRIGSDSDLPPSDPTKIRPDY